MSCRHVGSKLDPKWPGRLSYRMRAKGRLIVPEFAPPAPFLLETAGIDANPLYRSEGKPSYAVYELPGQYRPV